MNHRGTRDLINHGLKSKNLLVNSDRKPSYGSTKNKDWIGLEKDTGVGKSKLASK